MSTNHYPALHQVEAIQNAFEAAGYICTTRIATVIRLAAALEKPVLIEGPPGVGKTELAKTCATVVNRPLVRLQCYEGLDESKALYEWKYGKQLLYTQLLKEQLVTSWMAPRASTSPWHGYTSLVTYFIRRLSSNHAPYSRQWRQIKAESY